MADIVLSIRDLVLRFESPDGESRTVLSGVNFDVERGETLVIMGGSGCGKSTLLNCLIGELTPNQGTITYTLPKLGTVEFLSADEATKQEIRKKIGILFQSGALFSSMTVAENVALPWREHSRLMPNEIRHIVAAKLNLVHMLAHRDKYPAQLSGGQKKRAGLARAMSLDPPILFYDEPSAGLDPVTSAAIDELVVDLSQKLGITNIVVTHEMDSAFRIAHRMIMLEQGRILRIGPKSEFEALRVADPKSLASQSDRLINQFLNGYPHGPMTDVAGQSELEKILTGDTAIFKL